MDFTMGSARLLGAHPLPLHTVCLNARPSLAASPVRYWLPLLASLLPLSHAAALCALQVPAVRVAAIGGVCTVLDKFWELIPAGTIAGFVKRIASEYCQSAPLLPIFFSAPLTAALITCHRRFYVGLLH